MLSEYLLRVTPEMLAAINEGLMQVPFGRAAPAVNEINRQLREQDEAAKPKD